jgi:hypothetical protein
MTPRYGQGQPGDSAANDEDAPGFGHVRSLSLAGWVQSA